MNDLKNAWAGRLYGTNTGNVFVEYTQTENLISGLARFHDDRFGITIYDISGSMIEGKMKVRGVPQKNPPGTVVEEATIEVDLKQDGSLAGRWETTIGSAGTLKLYPHSYENMASKSKEPEQIYT